MDSEILTRVVGSRANWTETLSALATQLTASGATGSEAARNAIELAEALEYVDPDRTLAIQCYLYAWKAAHEHPEALARARELCVEIEQLDTVAKILRLEYQLSKDPWLLYWEGVSWIDAGHPDKAVSPLAAAEKEIGQPWQIVLALSTARQEWPDPREQILALQEEAAQIEPQVAAEKLLYAARILRMLSDEGREYGQFLYRAFSACPDDDAVMSRLENWLLGQNSEDSLLQVYEHRVEGRDLVGVVDDYRRAGTKLIKKGHSNLGGRLLSQAVQKAYAGGLEYIPGHLAAWQSLLESCSESSRGLELLPLLSEGLRNAVSNVDKIALSVNGLDLTIRKLRDFDASKQFVQQLRVSAPNHPLLSEVEALGIQSGAVPGASVEFEEQDSMPSIALPELSGEGLGEGKQSDKAAQELEDFNDGDCETREIDASIAQGLVASAFPVQVQAEAEQGDGHGADLELAAAGPAPEASVASKPEQDSWSSLGPAGAMETVERQEEPVPQEILLGRAGAEVETEMAELSQGAEGTEPNATSLADRMAAFMEDEGDDLGDESVADENRSHEVAEIALEQNDGVDYSAPTVSPESAMLAQDSSRAITRDVARVSENDESSDIDSAAVYEAANSAARVENNEKFATNSFEEPVSEPAEEEILESDVELASEPDAAEISEPDTSLGSDADVSFAPEPGVEEISEPEADVTFASESEVEEISEPEPEPEPEVEEIPEPDTALVSEADAEELFEPTAPPPVMLAAEKQVGTTAAADEQTEKMAAAKLAAEEEELALSLLKGNPIIPKSALRAMHGYKKRSHKKGKD